MTTERCIICAHPELTTIADRVRDSASHRVVQCRACGHRQLAPLPTPEEDAAFYEADLQQANIGQTVDLNSAKALLSDDTERRIQFISSRARPSRLLDVGAGFGYFVKRACEEGFQAEGIEVSSNRIATARRITTAPIHQLDLLERGHTLGTFDVITLFHVIEHLTDPIRLLRALGKMLTPGGALFIEVPNAADLMLEASDCYRAFWYQRAHISYFDDTSLRAVIERAEFDEVQLVGVHRYGIENMMHWLEHGRPQLSAPSYQTSGPYRWLEDYYKSELETSRRSDTLMAVARRRASRQAREA